MIARVTRSEFAEFLEQGKPAIITDALDDWRIAERWTPSYLASVATTRRVTLSTSSDGRYQFDPSHDRAKAIAFDNAEIDFGAATQRLLETDGDGDHIYLLQQSIPDVLPELLDNLVVPEWIASSHPMINLWFGRRTTTQLHFDYSNNLFAQLHGSKEFTLFAPDDTPRLYPYHHDAVTAHLSYVELDEPDLAKHPAFADATPYRFTIHPGELLFMPAFWWHHVRAADVAISVNFWWHPTLPQIAAAPNATRALPGFHAADRLTGFRQGFLEPAQLDFSTASRLFLEHGRTWTAGLLALAAFDEAARHRASPDDVPPPRGCWLSQLADDLQPARAALLADASLSAAERHAIERSAVLATQLAQSHDDATVDRASVEALLDTLHAHTSNGAEAPS